MFEIGTEFNPEWLRTHAAIIGMTGSGKTGLGIVMLEEANKQGIPAIIVDPKGDMPNLHCEHKIYTPGSNAGIPVSIISSLKNELVWDDNVELLREKINSIVTALLGLANITANPLDKEHILISNIVEHAWKNGKDLNMPALVNAIQAPDFDRLGVLPLDMFYPEKNRYDLAIKLNNFLAAPAFHSWIEGEPLDIDKFLEGNSIFYISHLSDQERMFFVTLLYSAIESWMSKQQGTEDLRALIYFDEVGGYLPPVKKTPVKPIILRLLKRARAYGVGLMLATQNPIDLDYKALSNIGTWMIGKLQTEQDKARLREGLDEDISLSGLDDRRFLFHSIYQKDKIFRVRDAVSKLTGPIVEIPKQEWTKREVETLNIVPAVPSKYEVYHHGTGPYQGFIGGRANVTFTSRKYDILIDKTITAIYDNGWKLFELVEGEPNGDYKPLDIPDLSKTNFEDWIYRSQYLTVKVCKELKMSGTEGEIRRAATEQNKIENLEAHAKYMDKINKLKVKVTREKQRLIQYEEKLKSRKTEEATSGLEVAISLIGGRRRSLSTPMTKHRMKNEAAQRVEQQKLKIERLKQEWELLGEQLKQDSANNNDKWNNVEIVEERIKPYKKDILTELFGVIWIGGHNEDSEPEGNTE